MVKCLDGGQISLGVNVVLNKLKIIKFIGGKYNAA
jgi:hypothetical protein